MHTFTPLEHIIKQKIATNGPLTIADFMADTLYHPKHGYYTTQNPFQDFTTAPELTPLFGETLAVWLVQTWQSMGSPKAFTLLECGPGRGTLMNDVLTTLQKIAPSVYASASPYLLEISPTLTATQKEILKNHPISWHQDLKTVPTDLPTILIANEFLDAFPIHQFEKIDHHWQERAVTYNTQEQKFQFTHISPQTPPHTLSFPQNTQTEDIHETSPAQINWLKNLSTQFKKTPLIAIFIDYAIIGGDTLQALKNHAFTHPLTHIGEADLTAHVNFQELAKHLPQNSTQLLDFNTFLIQYGLPLRLSQLLKNATPVQTEHLNAIADRLLNSKHMGTLFKCLIYKNNP